MSGAMRRADAGKAFCFAMLVGLIGAPACIRIEPDPVLCEPEDEACQGGNGTVFDSSSRAFGQSMRNLDRDELQRFEQGRVFFHARWVPEDGFSTNRGLGPLFNAEGCVACHQADGRAASYDSNDQPTPALLIRISALDDEGRAQPVPNYGSQLQTEAVDGLSPEARVSVRWEFSEGRFADGSTYELRRPVFSFSEKAYGEFPERFVHSPRATTSMIGLGLLEAIPAEAILALADPEDADGDGISGRPNMAVDAEDGSRRIGRFGWKASHGSLAAQNAAAFMGDMGIRTRRHQGSGCEAGKQQEACDAAQGFSLSDGFDIAEEDLDDMNFYTRHLAVPARRTFSGVSTAGDGSLIDLTEQAQRGEALFDTIGCAACHVASWVTRRDAASEALARQTIAPYTDLLLHDMGEGLADGRPDGAASGSEWRTAPLWGLGLTRTVNGHTQLLHDGRARTVEEAILWHGGEALGAKQRYEALSFGERQALLAFLDRL